MTANPSMKILIVDDNIMLSDMYATFLKRNDIEAVAAHTTTEALDITRELEFDVVIVDYDLPDMPGTTFIQLLKRRKATHRSVVILLTGYDIPASRMLIKPTLLLKKPILPSELLKVIRELVESAQSC